MKPIDGMKTDPYGLPLMAGAWIACLEWAATEEEVLDRFKKETGHDILSILNARGIDKMIDEATGHDKAVIVAWADWVTENFWGKDGD